MERLQIIKIMCLKLGCFAVMNVVMHVVMKVRWSLFMLIGTPWDHLFIILEPQLLLIVRLVMC